MSPWVMLRKARLQAGLTQAALAKLAGTTQPVIARLERPGANPRVSTLQEVMAAMGRRLQLDSVEGIPNEDETLIAAHLRMTPAERASYHDAGYRNVRELVLKARGG